MADVDESVPVLAVTAAVGAVVLLLVLLCNVGRKQESEEKEEKEDSTAKKKTSSGKKQNGSNKKQRPERKRKDTKSTFTHPWLANTLRGHIGLVTGFDFSANGKLFVTADDERSLLIWNTKSFSSKDNKSVKGNVEYDYATQIKFSPDNKALLVSLYAENTVRVIKIGKKPDGSIGNIQAALDFPKVHKQEISSIGICSTGKFIMTASSDTHIKIWDLKGELLTTIDTLQVNVSYAAVSPCGRFVASSGFTSDVKIWEVSFDKSGHYKEVARAFDLKGHSAGVYHFGFSEGSTRMVTVSKDGSWKLWDTDIEYKKGQDPYLLQTGKCKENGQSLIAISPDARTIALAINSSLYIYNAATAECTQTIADVFLGPFVELGFDISGRFLLCAGDKCVHSFHNITGYQATIVELETKKKKATTSAYKDRLQQQIDEAKSLLASVKEKLNH